MKNSSSRGLEPYLNRDADVQFFLFRRGHGCSFPAFHCGMRALELQARTVQATALSPHSPTFAGPSQALRSEAVRVTAAILDFILKKEHNPLI